MPGDSRLKHPGDYATLNSYQPRDGTELKVDSLFVCGVSTSGCVRATVVDAFSNNLRVQVVEEACFDRTEVSHVINLFDMNAKYADVVTEQDAIASIRKVGLARGEVPARRRKAATA
ncbi:MAG: isochorismatase family protein [Alphaproteobacteria bacterium]|nr:isochorismatase family protein [Alphaproteobacteria bacterium]